VTVRAALVALPLMLCLYAEDASAFCRTTTCNQAKPSDKCELDESGCEISKNHYPVFWKSNCVRFNVQRYGTANLDFAETKLTILRSFARWQDVECPGGGTSALSFTVGEDAFTKTAEYCSGVSDPLEPEKFDFGRATRNINVIFFRDDKWDYKGIDGTLATTSVSFDKNTGEIWDADIAVNSANNTLTVRNKKVQFDLESILVHEAGHFIGIAHSGDSSAIMNSTYNEGTIHRGLEPDDVAAVCEIYPPDRKAECQDEPKGGFADRFDPTVPTGACIASLSPSQPSLGAALLTLLFFLSRRRRT
jgi:Matrixin